MTAGMSVFGTRLWAWSCYSCFSSSSVMVPMVNCMRTRIWTGSLRRSSVSQTVEVRRPPVDARC